MLRKRKWQLIPAFLPEEFQGQRCLVDYSPSGRKEWDMTEQLTLSFSQVVTLCFIYIHVVEGIGEGDGTPLQLSCLENPMGGGAWWAAGPWDR